MIRYLWLFITLAFISGQLLVVPLCCGVRVTLLDLAVLVLFLYSIFTQSIKKKAVISSLKLFGPFVTIALVSLLLQLGKLTITEIGISSLYLVRFVLYASILPVALSVKKKERVLKYLFVGGTCITALGIAQYFLYPNLRNLSYLGWDPHQFRVFSTLLDPNFTGLILVLTIFLSLYLIRTLTIQHKNTLWRNFVIMASGLSFVALLLTYSRGSYVAFLAGIFVWSVIENKIKWFMAIVLLLIGFLILLPKPGGEGVNLFRYLSVEARLENSREAWKLFLRSPIIGKGFNTLRYVRGETEIVEGTQRVSHSGAGFHNSYFFILATTGATGLIAYFWIWYRIYKKVLAGGKNIRENSLVQLIIVSTVVIFTHSLFDNSLFFPPVMFWLWLLVGSTIGLRG